ncbi:MAG: hypothetical protein ABGY95_10215 [Rubritalea sp.]|uniref:hypothetical protein n=1 Tax=Rubritalea sp. TaxID=2109375 RepID=UPI003241C534
MADSILIQDILAKKAAGVERMRMRQLRVQERLADRIDQHPEAIADALSRVRQYLEQPNCTCRAIYEEWLMVLTTKSAGYIANIMRDTSADTDQLRACSPFVLD